MAMKRLAFLRATLLAPFVAMGAKRLWPVAPTGTEVSWLDDLRVGETWTSYGFKVGDSVSFDDGSGPMIFRITDIGADTITVDSP